jgi:hypothetical protein
MVSRPIGAIDHDLKAIETQVLREGRLGEMDVAATRIFDPLGSADAVGFDQFGTSVEQRLDCKLVLVVELESVRAEQFDAIVVERIVAG